MKTAKMRERISKLPVKLSGPSVRLLDAAEKVNPGRGSVAAAQKEAATLRKYGFTDKAVEVEKKAATGSAGSMTVESFLKDATILRDLAELGITTASVISAGIVARLNHVNYKPLKEAGVYVEEEEEEEEEAVVK